MVGLASLLDLPPLADDLVRVEDALLQRHIDSHSHQIPKLRAMRGSGSLVSGTKDRPVTSS